MKSVFLLFYWNHVFAYESKPSFFYEREGDREKKREREREIEGEGEFISFVSLPQ